mmetsp:Transcript_50664/g.108520  ORF Transcript_50664/g.108520 Transcript_50664/m.108520 type:complete len:209 (-) Transcript_50664:332-958(-)
MAFSRATRLGIERSKLLKFRSTPRREGDMGKGKPIRSEGEMVRRPGMKRAGMPRPAKVAPRMPALGATRNWDRPRDRGGTIGCLIGWPRATPRGEATPAGNCPRPGTRSWDARAAIGAPATGRCPSPSPGRVAMGAPAAGRRPSTGTARCPCAGRAPKPMRAVPRDAEIPAPGAGVMLNLSRPNRTPPWMACIREPMPSTILPSSTWI